MLDAETRMLLDLMEAATKAGRPKLETLPHAIGRKSVDKMSEDSEADPPEVAETIDGAFAGPGGEIKYRRYLPLGVEAGSLPTLIYYHGGGFVICDLETHDAPCRLIAQHSGCRVLSVDYRLAPEHKYPAAADDALAAFRDAVARAEEFGAALAEPANNAPPGRTMVAP